jgi:hypothetical protein
LAGRARRCHESNPWARADHATSEPEGRHSGETAQRIAQGFPYLQRFPGDVEALKELLGHRSIATTQIYLRKLDRASAMERVRGLSWAVAESGDDESSGSPQTAGERFECSSAVGAGGFEPPFDHMLGELRRGGLRELLEALRRVLEELDVS